MWIANTHEHQKWAFQIAQRFSIVVSLYLGFEWIDQNAEYFMLFTWNALGSDLII